MNKKIEFSKETTYTGRNGIMDCSGINIELNELTGSVMIAPVTFLGKIDRPLIAVPTKDIFALYNLLGEFCQNEIQVRNAGNYLCENDQVDEQGGIISTDKQVELIKKHAETAPDDLIDNVEGVMVCEAVEYRLTCENFLFMIS